MRRRQGFTVIELVVVIVVAGILIMIAIQAMGAVQHRMASEQAARTFQTLHARARAHAIEGGTNTRLVVDVAGDSVSVRRGGDALETIRFREEFGVDITGSSLILCMGPRGYADTDCNSFTSPITLSFTQNGKTESVQLLPLGQLVRP